MKGDSDMLASTNIFLVKVCLKGVDVPCLKLSLDYFVRGKKYTSYGYRVKFYFTFNHSSQVCEVYRNNFNSVFYKQKDASIQEYVQDAYSNNKPLRYSYLHKFMKLVMMNAVENAIRADDDSKLIRGLDEDLIDNLRKRLFNTDGDDAYLMNLFINKSIHTFPGVSNRINPFVIETILNVGFHYKGFKDIDFVFTNPNSKNGITLDTYCMVTYNGDNELFTRQIKDMLGYFMLDMKCIDHVSLSDLSLYNSLDSSSSNSTIDFTKASIVLEKVFDPYSIKVIKAGPKILASYGDLLLLNNKTKDSFIKNEEDENEN